MKKQCIVLISILSLVGCTGQTPKPNIESTVESNSSVPTTNKEINGSKPINEINQNVVNEDINITQNKIKEIELLFQTAKKLSSDGNHSKALNKCEEVLRKIKKEDTVNVKKAENCIEKEKKIVQEILNEEKNAKISKMFDEAKKLSGSQALSKYDEIIQLSEDKAIIKKAFIAKKSIIDTLDIKNSELAKFYFEYAQHTSFYEYFKKSGDLYYHYSDMTNQVERNNTLKSYLEFYRYVQNNDEVLYKIGYLYTISKDWINSKKFISKSKALGNYDADQLWINEKLYGK